ncbi:TEL2, telomere maintenance protein 2 [Chamberlinius hualienensis]
MEEFDQLVSDLIICLTEDNNLTKCVLKLKRCVNSLPDRGSDNREYLRLLDCLLNGVHSKWYKTVSQEEPQLFDNFFLKHSNKEILFLLLRNIDETRPNLKLEKCLCLVEKLMLSNNFSAVIVEECKMHNSPVKQDLNSTEWQYLITSVISLPDKVAPLTKFLATDISDKFIPNTYFQLISGAIIKTLETLHVHLQESVDVNLEFLRLLIGRCCLSGHTEELLSPLIQFLKLKTEKDFTWRRLSQKLLTAVLDQYLEIIITFVFKKCNSYVEVRKLLGTSAIEDARVNRLITHKLLLVRYFPDDQFLYNLLGYLSDFQEQKVLVEIFLRVIDAWGNKTCVKYRQFLQHFYLTKILILSLRFMNDTTKERNKKVILEKMTNAMDAHLSSPLKSLHQVGMVTAVLITKIIDSSGPQLQFKYEEDDIANELQSLLTYEPNIKQTLNDLEKEPEKLKDEPVNVDKSANRTKPVVAELDSDDDLEPYDMSHDVRTSKYTRPRYLRDCIEGLLVKDDPDRLETSLEAVEELVRKNSVGLEDVAVELTNILLCLENIGAINNFSSLRFNAMVGTTVGNPKQVATFLCEQFYMRNYNIRQRLDMLEVLVEAAKELSKPRQTEKLITIVKSKSQGENSVGKEDWKSIVQQRIDSKTRYFHKTHVRKEIIGQANIFGSVAGYFFFPLMTSYDSREKPFDLLGTDFFLLGRLVWCLGSVLHAAKNCPMAVHMGQSLLDFVSVIRQHVEPYVRRAVVFAVCEVIVTVPSKLLFGSLQDRIVEHSEWLRDVIEHDTDPECQNLAMKTFMLLNSLMKDELQSEIKESS